MQKTSAGAASPELRSVVVEAYLALARSDAERLEELAHFCAALNGTLEASIQKDLYCQARAAAPDMTIFARVLDATRLNLAVMTHARERRIGQLEYGTRQIIGMLGTETRNGVD